MILTDEDILAAADRIKRRRALERQRDAAKDADMLMVRWNVKGGSPGYASVPVTYDQVKHLIEPHFETDIAANQTFLDTGDETK